MAEGRTAAHHPEIDPGKLRALRQQRLIVTQAELAQRAGVSRATISLLESARRIPGRRWPPRTNVNTLRQLCEALGCEPAEILTEQEGNTNHGTTARR